MERGNFFVMLCTQGGGYTPLMAEDDIAKFETAEAAKECAHGNLLGNHFADSRCTSVAQAWSLRPNEI